jgi:transcriptional regulator with XRE-family HTH domain
MAHSIGGIDEPTRDALRVLGHVLRTLRAERGLSQRALATRCGLSQPTISRLERGLAEGVRVAWIARLLAGLDTRVKFLPVDRVPFDEGGGFRLFRTAFDRENGRIRTGAREVARLRYIDSLVAGSRDEKVRSLMRPEFPRVEPRSS